MAAAEVDVDVREEMPETLNDLNTQATGSCLCRSVSYRVTGTLRNIVGCHCAQCRKTSGNYVTATAVADEDLHIEANASLSWFPSSALAKRGFCKRCGGNLFWKHANNDYTSIMAGTLDLPTNLKLSHHIYVADASDYHCFGENDVTYEQDD